MSETWKQWVRDLSQREPRREPSLVPVDPEHCWTSADKILLRKMEEAFKETQ